MHHVPVFRSRRQTGIALAFAAAVVSGFSVYLNAFALREFGNPTLYTTVKNLVAAVLLLGLITTLTARRAPGGFRRPRGTRQIAGLVTVGILGGGIPFVLFFEGLARSSASSAGFIQKTLVLWVAVLAVSFLRERFGPAHVAAIALLIGGQIVLSGGLVTPALGTGEAMIFIATLLWAVEVVVAKRLLASLTPLTVACARMGIGSIVLTGFAITSGAAAAIPSLSAGQWGWAILTGLVLTVYVATWFSALALAQAVDVTAVLVFGAIITAVLNSGGRLATLAPSLTGLVLIAAGALAIALLARRSEREVRQPQM